MTRPFLPSRLSPCTGVCVIDAASRLCAGCGRTTSEISLWDSLDDDARRAVMAELPARMRAAGLREPRQSASR